MQLETVVKIWVFGASFNLGNGVGLERINTAKGAKPIADIPLPGLPSSHFLFYLAYSSDTGGLFGLPY